MHPPLLFAHGLNPVNDDYVYTVFDVRLPTL